MGKIHLEVYDCMFHIKMLLYRVVECHHDCNWSSTSLMSFAHNYTHISNAKGKQSETIFVFMEYHRKKKKTFKKSECDWMFHYVEFK